MIHSLTSTIASSHPTTSQPRGIKRPGRRVITKSWTHANSNIAWAALLPALGSFCKTRPFGLALRQTMRLTRFARHATASGRWVRFAKTLVRAHRTLWDASIAVNAMLDWSLEVAMQTPSTSRPSLFGSD